MRFPSTWDTCLIFYSLKPYCNRSLYHQRLFLREVKTTKASDIYSVQLHFIQLITLLELQLLFMYAWETAI